MLSLSYHADLKKARQWRVTQSADDLNRACALLRKLRVSDPHVLDIGHELVLVLEKLADLPGAIRELQALEKTFPNLDEETLCRGGKIHKKMALEAYTRGQFGHAIAEYQKAEDYYHRAFEVRHGFYPRINELTIRLLRASVHAKLADTEGVPADQRELARLESQKLLGEVQREALGVLNDPTVWTPRLDDDNIWLPATKGEAAFLCGKWDIAAEEYVDATHKANGKVFYFGAMRDQLKMLRDAFQTLNVTVQGPLADPDLFFAIPNPSE